MSAHESSDGYVMGRTDGEERRLQLQHRIIGPGTRRLFEAAGIGPGMTVLDLGSGAGDVAMLAAEMVGPAGRVLGVDMNPTVLETARRRAAAAGHGNVEFLCADLREVEIDERVDAVVGRVVLCHLSEPAAVLRRLVPRLRPGGVAAFHEAELSLPPASYPPADLFRRAVGWVKDALAHGGVDVAMGLKLPRLFCEAGLEAPRAVPCEVMLVDHADLETWAEYVAATARPLLPLIVAGGIATEAEVDVETLAARCLAEMAGQGSVVRLTTHAGAWARTR